ncbi:MAG: serine/threonine-protein kinase, partial [Planctomycetota bacterium]|nr:serine/threonine-protein kinase [Planctomycetota bacterium]
METDSSRPSTIGHFAVERLLGRGGMGVVYLCHDPLLDRKVAIKTLRAASDGHDDRLDHLRREARALARLNHPAIAQIHQLLDLPEGAFLVIEFVEGETLHERLRAGPLPIEEALRCGAGIADALQAAHDRGVVHRDLKPANVMITRSGDPKVMDFGIAMLAAPDRAANVDPRDAETA